MAGWVFEMLWQAFFQLQSKIGMWICLALILGALISFGRALLRLYGCGLILHVPLHNHHWCRRLLKLDAQCCARLKCLGSIGLALRGIIVNLMCMRQMRRLKQSQGPLHSVLLFASYWLPTRCVPVDVNPTPATICSLLFRAMHADCRAPAAVAKCHL